MLDALMLICQVRLRNALNYQYFDVLKYFLITAYNLFRY